MLSIENNPDPSCSNKISGVLLKNDERASSTVALEDSDLLKSGLDDDKHLISNFSIRDYVFTTRRKGIERNWPFPQEYLEICVKHGIRDPLPPFEPPDSVINRSLRKNCVDGKKGLVEVNSLEKEENVKLDGESRRSKSKSCVLTDQSVLSLSDQTRSPLQEEEKLTAGPLLGTDSCRLSVYPSVDDIEQVLPTVISNPSLVKERISTSRLTCSGEVGPTSSKSLKELEVSVAPNKKNKTTSESPSKKCKLIEKSGIVSDPNHVEDIASSATTISEPMASKVCPVCKTFLSTSNTTLNAHIDQCLAMGSTSSMLNVSFTLNKHKIKPRKKRLMVDIYETAPRCTLEDLDRRNGSNWAADSKLPTENAEFCAEGNKKRLSQAYPEDVNDESAVYFDSNGRKVLILSKLDDASVPKSAEEFKAKKHTNEKNERNIGLTSKVKCLGSKDAKHPKFKAQTKKFCSFKPDQTEICGVREENDEPDANFEKEDCISELPKAHDGINSGGLRQWVCSKRTGLSKKLTGKDAFRGLRYTSLMARDPLIENNQSNVSNSSVETFRKLPNPLENPNSSLKIDKGLERSPRPPEHLNRLNGCSTSSMDVGGKLKFSRPSQNHVTSPRSKRVEIHNVGATEKSDNLPKRKTINPSEIWNPVLPKEKMLSTVRKNVLSVEPSSLKSKSNKDNLRKSCMHRSTVTIREQVRTMWSGMNDGIDDSTENNCVSPDRIRGEHKFVQPNKFMRREEIGIVRSGGSVSEQDREISRTSGRKERKALGGLESGPKSSTLGLHVGANSSNSFPEKSNEVEFAAEEVQLNGEDTAVEPYNARFNCFQSCRTESWRDSLEQCFCDGHQEPNYSKDVSYITQRILTAPDLDCYNIGRGNSFSENERTECRSEQISIPGPPGFFLPSPGEDISSEIPVENSSITSNRLLSSQDQSVLVDRDSSGSPVSATSTISHLHTHASRSDSNYMDPKLFAVPSVVLGKFVPSLSSDDNTKHLVGGDATTFSCAPNVGNAETINLDTESLKDTKNSLAEGSLKSTDDQSKCCCSRKERIPWDDSVTYQALLQPTKQHNMAPSVSPSIGIQINNQVVFNSSSGCSSSKTNEKANSMNSFSDSFSLKKSSDDALKFSSHGDFGSANAMTQSHHHTQSTSNPVLRLMGKNLMVVNKEDDSSSQYKEAPPSVVPDSTYSMVHNVSAGNDEDYYNSLYRMVSDGSVIFDNNRQYDPPPMNRFGINFSESYGNHVHSKNILYRNLEPPAGNHYNNHHMGGFMSGSFLPQHGRKDVTDHSQSSTLKWSSVDRPNPHFRCNVERDTAAPQQILNPSYVATDSSREVIVINNSPENEEADLRMKYAQESSDSPVPVGILPSLHQDVNLRQVNPFFSYQSLNPCSSRETPVGHRGGTNSPLKQGDINNTKGTGLSLQSSICAVYCRPIL